MNGKCIIVMGVSGCGKSTIGKMIAEEVRAEFVEGDDFHSKSNIEKMRSGIPLTDADRHDWLNNIHEKIAGITGDGKNCVVSCSALKLKYRTILSENIRHILFVYLDGSFELIHGWMVARKHHFMPVQLLQSQFDTLEKPTAEEKNAITIEIDTSIEQEMKNIRQQLKERGFLL